MKTKQLQKLLEVGELLTKALGTERFEWQTTKLFMVVCMHGGEVPQAELEKHTKLTGAAVSRNIAKLGAGLTMDDQGARLVESYEDPAWRRRKYVRLTARGKELCEKLTTILER